MITEPEWEKVRPLLYRLKVPGGWIYERKDHMVFVPTPTRNELDYPE